MRLDVGTIDDHDFVSVAVEHEGHADLGSEWLRFRYTTFPLYHCGGVREHGNYVVTGYAKADWAYPANGASPRTSTSAIAVVANGGALRNAARVYDFTQDGVYGPTSYLQGACTSLGHAIG